VTPRGWGLLAAAVILLGTGFRSAIPTWPCSAPPRHRRGLRRGSALWRPGLRVDGSPIPTGWPAANRRMSLTVRNTSRCGPPP
jgi:hypothetical protein